MGTAPENRDTAMRTTAKQTDRDGPVERSGRRSILLSCRRGGLSEAESGGLLGCTTLITWVTTALNYSSAEDECWARVVASN